MTADERRDRAADILAEGVLRLLAQDDLVEAVADEVDGTAESRTADGGLYRVTCPTPGEAK